MEPARAPRLFRDLGRMEELCSIPLYELGLTRPQAATLMMSSGPPDCEGDAPEHPLRVSDLARMIGVSAAAVSQMLSGLEAKGLIERRPSARDRRVVEVWPTDKGLDLAAQVKSNYERLAAKLTERLTAEESKALAGLISRIERIIEEEAASLEGPGGKWLRRCASGGRPPHARGGKECKCENTSDT